MSESFSLRAISTAAIPRALERAERYRLLNDPELAESICLDILEVDPDNEAALVMLVLALTDQFGTSESPPSQQRVAEYVNRLADEYRRVYYGGLIRERQAHAFLRRGISRVFAFDGFVEAMEWYERAADIRPEGEDEALLRWNSCVRTIRRANLHPRPEEPELQLE